MTSLATRHDIEYEMCGLAGLQVGLEIAMLGELLQAQHDYDDVDRHLKAVRRPTGLESSHIDLLIAIADVHHFSPPVTADSVLDRIGDFGWEVRRYERWVRGLAARPRLEPASHYAQKVAEVSAQRRMLGQRIWSVALYRWYDAQDRLIYVGISGSLGRRQDSHAKRSSWEQFAVRSIIERYPTREDAEYGERIAIVREHPIFNHVHNDTPEARQRLVAYLIEHGRTDLLAPAVSRG